MNEWDRWFKKTFHTETSGPLPLSERSHSVTSSVTSRKGTAYLKGLLICLANRHLSKISEAIEMTPQPLLHERDLALISKLLGEATAQVALGVCSDEERAKLGDVQVPVKPWSSVSAVGTCTSLHNRSA